MMLADCSSCEEGYISTEKGCEVCSIGKFWNESNSCVPCSKGFFSAQNGLLSCQPCEFGKWSSTENSTAASNCMPCPVLSGVSCPQGSSVPFVKAGWYRSTDSLDTVYLCLPEESCLEAGFGNSSCKDGLFGQLSDNWPTSLNAVFWIILSEGFWILERLVAQVDDAISVHQLYDILLSHSRTSSWIKFYG
jgi:hypothetical protein